MWALCWQIDCRALPMGGPARCAHDVILRKPPKTQVCPRDFFSRSAVACASKSGTHFVLRLRQTAACPIYTLSLILDFASVALGRLAAWIAGDDWP
jgi:hypothetical protein